MLTLYRPFTSSLRDELFGDRDFAPWAGAWGLGQRFNPVVDVVETDGAYLLKAELPGLAPENIDVQVENDVITLRGERKNDTEEQRAGYRRVERSYGSFARSFVLPKSTPVDAIEAQVQHGVLTVTVPKAPAAAARKVEVKGGGLIDKAKKIFSKPADSAQPTPQA